jgi:diguanylate cyclase (GGDEF)-like protein/PAS domain S-box-containing protein
MKKLNPQFDDADRLWARIDAHSSSFYARLLDSIVEGVYFVDAERKITYWNRGAENLTGYSARETVQRHCYDNFLGHADEKGCALCTNGCPLTSTLLDGQRREADVFLRHKLGHRVPVYVRVAPITDDQSGQIVGAVEAFSDVSAKKRVERRVRELEGMAFRDNLTSLPNRRYIELKVKQSLEELQQFGRPFGLLMFDVDHFKDVNDRYGHDAGDGVLKAISETMTKSLRENDIVGRWGGEEFLAILLDVNAGLLRDLAERCRSLVAQSGALSGDSRISVTVSVGATLVTREDSIHDAIKRADQLMYVSKSSGRNRITIG